MQKYDIAQTESIQLVTLNLYSDFYNTTGLSQYDVFQLLRDLAMDFEKEYQEYFEKHPDADWYDLCDKFCERMRCELHKEYEPAS